VSLQLLAMLQPSRPLDEIIEDIGKHAQEAGLTPELLEELLRDDA